MQDASEKNQQEFLLLEKQGAEDTDGIKVLSGVDQLLDTLYEQQIP